MDRLEKEWFDLVKDIPKPLSEERHYPDVCSICDGKTLSIMKDGEAENSNAIVFCDGCDLAVHQDCYGVPFIPEGQWLCRKCMLSPDKPISCILCPGDSGAFKKTNSNKWAHLLCAMWIPECHISNTVFMEPIEGIDLIPKSRWKLIWYSESLIYSYICQKKCGAPIQCASRNCFVAFHPTCARKAKLFMKMRSQSENVQFKAFCDKHCPKEYKEKVNVDYHLALAHSELSRPKPIEATPKSSSSKSKSAAASESRSRTPSRKFSLANPIIPAAILQKLSNDSNLSKKRPGLLIAICKYWSLKKESVRGAALLKRLHLEPWTANATASKEDDEHRAQKYEVSLF
jgi:hypothetical protein